MSLRERREEKKGNGKNNAKHKRKIVKFDRDKAEVETGGREAGQRLGKGNGMTTITAKRCDGCDATIYAQRERDREKSLLKCPFRRKLQNTKQARGNKVEG